MKLYLDNCCFNRPFDDQTQLRISLETEAKLKIQEYITMGRFKLVWSYILDYENSKNPFIERNNQIAKWSNYAILDIDVNSEILDTANVIANKGVKKIDSLHIACAIFAKANCFLTTDDGILKKKNLIKEINITDPIGFIKELTL